MLRRGELRSPFAGDIFRFAHYPPPSAYQTLSMTPAQVRPPPKPTRITRWPLFSLPLSFISASASGMLAALVLA